MLKPFYNSISSFRQDNCGKRSFFAVEQTYSMFRVSRLVRKALSFSKKLDNHTGAIKHFICHYNFQKALLV